MNKPDLNVVVKFKVFGYEFIVRKFVPLEEVVKQVKKRRGERRDTVCAPRWVSG
jgi:hypothetical protein